MSKVQESLLEQEEKHTKRTYYLANKERIIAYQKRYRKTEMGRATRIRYRRRQRQRVIAALGGKCAKCGFSDWRALQIDHINGGGSIEQRHIGAPRIISKILRGETDRGLIDLSWLEKEDLKWNESN